MKYFKWLPIIALCSILASCFKDEPLNAECDIEQAYLHADHPETMFFNPSDSLVNVVSTTTRIDFSVRKGTDLTALAPFFRLTPGATISPASGQPMDFSQGPVAYTVTSEDKQWHRNYQVAVNITTHTVTDSVYLDFENYYLDPKTQKYYLWTDVQSADNTSYNWATANAGYSMRPMKPDENKPENYPTVPEPDGYDGAAIKLVTRSTGDWGVRLHKSLAAGNLFLGEFDATKALLQPLQATRFGVRFSQKPVKVVGYYKYQAGPQCQDKDGNPLPNMADHGDIYAVLYKNTDSNGNAFTLTGEDPKHDVHVVALAEMPTMQPAADWTKFELNFVYSADIDEDRLANFGYNIAIVCTSSYDGDNFNGAVGSTLELDKLRIVCAKEE